MSYCIKSLKTGRCVKSNYQDTTSSECNYNYTTKRCNSTKKISRPKTISKPKSISRPKTISRPKSLKSRIIHRPSIKLLSNTINYHGYSVEPNVKTYLETLLKKMSGKKIREINAKLNLYLPVDNYPNDNDLKEYIIKDILELSDNDTRDRTKTNAITLNNIRYVMVRDDVILVLFRNQYKGYVKIKGNEYIIDNNKVMNYVKQLNLEHNPNYYNYSDSDN